MSIKLCSNSLYLLSISKQAFVLTNMRCLATHWNPMYRKQRANKVVKPKLFEFETESKQKKEQIKRGVMPPHDFSYKPLNFSSSEMIFDPYVPPEGDGKASLLTRAFASTAVEKVSKAFMKKLKHARVIKKHDSLFDESTFGELAQAIYIDAHNCLMSRDNDLMINHVTEHALKQMTENMRFKTIRWKWVEPLEEPVVLHMITQEMITKSELFAQVTVRIHSKQILAIYDRFGRLALGSETLPKDVLEYVVFERHLTNMYGSWRLHDKIKPSWAQPTQSDVIGTYVKPELLEVDEEALKKIDPKFKSDDKHLDKVEEKA